VNDVAEAVVGVKRLAELDRARVRRRFDERFTVERLALEYVSIYRSLPGIRGTQGDRPGAASAFTSAAKAASGGRPAL
jgi:hypothetical protein